MKTQEQLRELLNTWGIENPTISRAQRRRSHRLQVKGTANGQPISLLIGANNRVDEVVMAPWDPRPQTARYDLTPGYGIVYERETPTSSLNLTHVQIQYGEWKGRYKPNGQDFRRHRFYFCPEESFPHIPEGAVIYGFSGYAERLGTQGIYSPGSEPRSVPQAQEKIAELGYTGLQLTLPAENPVPTFAPAPAVRTGQLDLEGGATVTAGQSKVAIPTPSKQGIQRL